MKLYPLLLGRTKVPFGQFYGGLKGWEGLGALLRFITDKRHFIWVPIHAYLLERPKEGLVLVDAGICPEQAHQHSQYYRGLLRLILDEDEYAQEATEALPEQLKRRGFRCEDVRTVILTHLHEDHVGALRDVKKAKIVIALAGVLIAPVAHRALHKFHLRRSQAVSNERMGEGVAQQSVAGGPPDSRERS